MSAHAAAPDGDEPRPLPTRARTGQRMPAATAPHVLRHGLLDLRKHHLHARIAPPQTKPSVVPQTSVLGLSGVAATASSSKPADAVELIVLGRMTTLQRATCPTQAMSRVAAQKNAPSRLPLVPLAAVGVLKLHKRPSTPPSVASSTTTTTPQSSVDVDLEAGPQPPDQVVQLAPAPVRQRSATPPPPASPTPPEPSTSRSPSAEPPAAAAKPAKKQKQKKTKAAWKSAAFEFPPEPEPVARAPSPTVSAAVTTAPADIAPAVVLQPSKSKKDAKRERREAAKAKARDKELPEDSPPNESNKEDQPPVIDSVSAVALPAATAAPVPKAAAVIPVSKSTTSGPSSAESKLLSSAVNKASAAPPSVWASRIQPTSVRIAPKEPGLPAPVSAQPLTRAQLPAPPSTGIDETRSTSASAFADQEVSQSPSRDGDSSMLSVDGSDYDDGDSVEIITHLSSIPQLSAISQVASPPPEAPSGSRAAEVSTFTAPRRRSAIAIVAPPGLSHPSGLSHPAPRDVVVSAYESGTSGSERPSTPSLSSTCSRAETESRRESVSVFTPVDASPPKTIGVVLKDDEEVNGRRGSPALDPQKTPVASLRQPILSQSASGGPTGSISIPFSDLVAATSSTIRSASMERAPPSSDPTPRTTPVPSSISPLTPLVSAFVPPSKPAPSPSPAPSKVIDPTPLLPPILFASLHDPPTIDYSLCPPDVGPVDALHGFFVDDDTQLGVAWRARAEGGEPSLPQTTEAWAHDPAIESLDSGQALQSVPPSTPPLIEQPAQAHVVQPPPEQQPQVHATQLHVQPKPLEELTLAQVLSLARASYPDVAQHQLQPVHSGPSPSEYPPQAQPIMHPPMPPLQQSGTQTPTENVQTFSLQPVTGESISLSQLGFAPSQPVMDRAQLHSHIAYQSYTHSPGMHASYSAPPFQQHQMLSLQYAPSNMQQQQQFSPPLSYYAPQQEAAYHQYTTSPPPHMYVQQTSSLPTPAATPVPVSVIQFGQTTPQIAPPPTVVPATLGVPPPPLVPSAVPDSPTAGKSVGVGSGSGEVRGRGGARGGGSGAELRRGRGGRLWVPNRPA